MVGSPEIRGAGRVLVARPAVLVSAAATAAVLVGAVVAVLGAVDTGGAVRVGMLVPAATATVAGVVLIAQQARDPEPWYRRLLGVALLVWAAGQLWNAVAAASGPPQFPTHGDLLSFASGPLALVAALLLLRTRPGMAPTWRLGIDATLLGLALALPTWQFLFDDAPARIDTAHVAALVVLLLEAVVVGLATLAYLRDLDPNLLLGTVGAAAFAVGDLVTVHAALIGAAQWPWHGAALIASGWTLIACGMVRYRPPAPAEPDLWSAEADGRGMRITTTTSLALLLLSLIALFVDDTPDRTSIGLVALAILVFWARELVNARSRGQLLYRLHDEATADPLTGLANRRVLSARMRTLAEGEPWCLLTVDLDGFKDVNDLLGHAIGDDLLVAVARRLRESAPPGALVSRIGGDEFAVLLAGDIDVGARVGGAIVTAVRQSAADVEGVARVEVSASVGVAAVHRGGAAVEAGRPIDTQPVDVPDGRVHPTGTPPEPEPTPVSPEGLNGTPPATIIDLRDHSPVHFSMHTTHTTSTNTTSTNTASTNTASMNTASMNTADRFPAAVQTHSPVAVVDPLSALSASGAALRVAKAAGRNRVEVYDEEIATMRRRRLRVEERLRVAVETDAITVRFQPIVDLRRGVVAGAEALARWVDPELGRVDPGEFITVAEQTGLVVALGERVLEETLSAGVREGLFDRGLRLSWNVSPVQLRVAGFDRVVHEAIAAHKVPRELLVMEVTEQVLVEEGQAAQTLRRIAKLGVTIAIDDFGTGYSALGYLHRLPADILKIDQSLTSSLVAEPRSRAITRAVLDLGRTVGLSVVVEGVESDQIHDLVRRMGIGYGQGMHYGPAMPGPELAELADRLNTASS